MSACENGSKLSWNEELGAVNLKTNTSEKCYVYFDLMTYSFNHSIGSRNTMELSTDGYGRVIASTNQINTPGVFVTEIFHIVATSNVTNLNIKVRYNPSADAYKGRVTISYDGSLAPNISLTGESMYVDGEPIIITGTLYQGEELFIRVRVSDFLETFENIELVVEGDGLTVPDI